MANPLDLTGQDIETTYQRVLQTDGVSVYDGTGSLVNINLTGSTSFDSSSFATTGSNIFIGNQTVTGSIYVSNSISAQYLNGIIDGGSF